CGASWSVIVFDHVLLARKMLCEGRESCSAVPVRSPWIGNRLHVLYPTRDPERRPGAARAGGGSGRNALSRPNRRGALEPFRALECTTLPPDSVAAAREDNPLLDVDVAGGVVGRG